MLSRGTAMIRIRAAQQALSLLRLGGHLDMVGTTSAGRGPWQSARGGGSQPSTRPKRLEESGKGLQQAADELGIHANQLRGWRSEQRAAGSTEALAKQKAVTAERARYPLRKASGSAASGSDEKRAPGWIPGASSR